MASFVDLPNELLCDVFSDLGQQDLANLCLVSRGVRSVTEPFLYRKVSLSTFRKPVPAFGRFQHAIRARPVLMNYLRSLTLRWDYIPAPSWYSPHELPTPAPIDAWLFGLVMSLFVRSEPAFHGRNVIPFVQNFPRLEVLHLWPSGDLHMIDLPRWPNPVPRLECLREVRCHWDTSKGTMYYETFMFLLMLPSMRILEARLAQSSLNSIPARCFGKSTVSELHLCYGYMTPLMVRDLLHAPRALTHFSYHTLRTTGWEMAAVGLGLEEHVRPTLQSLALTIGRPGKLYPWGMHHGSGFTIGPLREWPVLRSVRTSLTVLLGRGPVQTTLHLVDVLPVGIRELEVEMDPYWTVQEIANEVVEMLHLKQSGDFALLAVVTVPGEVYEAAEWLGAACDDVGVQLVMTRLV